MNNKLDKNGYDEHFGKEPFLICQWKPNGTLTAVNYAYCQFFNKTEKELIGQSRFDQIYYEDRRELLDHIDSLNHPEASSITELRSMNQSGEIRWFRWIDHYVYDSTNDQSIIVSVGQDITERIQTESRLKKGKNFDQLVTDLSIDLINAPLGAIDQYINHILAKIGKLLQVDRSYFFILDRENNTISNTHEWCQEGIEPQIDNLQDIPYEALPWWMKKLNNSEIINIPDVEKLPPEAQAERLIFLKKNIKSLLNVTLSNVGTLLGFIGVDSVNSLRTWANDDISTLKYLSGIIGSAITRKRNNNELTLRKRGMEKLYDITNMFLNINNVMEMLDSTIDKLRTIINADFCTIVLWDEKRQKFSIASSSGILAEKHQETTLDPCETSMSMSVLQSGHILIAEDALNSPYTNKEFIRKLKINSMLGIPMVSNHAKLGVVLYGFLRRHQFNNEEIALTQQATSQIVLAFEKIQLFEQTQKNEKAATRLHKASAIVASTLKPDIAIELILDQLESVVPFESASVQILENDHLEIRAGRGWPEGFNPVGQKLPIPGDNPNTIVIQTKKPYVLNNAPEEYANFTNPNKSNIRSWLGVPLVVHDNAIGMLTLDHHEPQYYDDDRIIELVTAFANHVAISLENARLYEVEHRRVMELNALRETTTDITRELGLKNLLHAILERATALMNATGGELGLIEDDGKHLQILVSHNMGSDNVGETVELGQGFMGYVAQTRQIEMIENYKNWENRLDTYEETNIYAAIGAPLMIGNRILGVIGIMDSDRDRKFSSAEKDLLRLFAQQASIGIENAKLFEEKERQARVDVTTNIYNRRGLMDLGKRELDRAYRYERPLAAMMLDIDRFKLVNDTYGHAIGDLVLKELATLITDNIRSIDIFGRYGGEEFVILLPETTPDSAYEIAERLREAVADHIFTPENLELKITISIGIAFTSGKDDTLTDLIKQADDAMYRSKGAGRNRTSIINPP